MNSGTIALMNRKIVHYPTLNISGLLSSGLLARVHCNKLFLEFYFFKFRTWSILVPNFPIQTSPSFASIKLVAKKRSRRIFMIILKHHDFVAIIGGMTVEKESGNLRNPINVYSKTQSLGIRHISWDLPQNPTSHPGSSEVSDEINSEKRKPTCRRETRRNEVEERRRLLWGEEEKNRLL